MPYSLSEHSKYLKDDMESGMVKSMLEPFPWMDLFEVKTIPGRETRWRRLENIGSVSKRAINQTYAESYATTSVQTATLTFYGRYIDIDKELLDEPTAEDEAAMQVDAAAKAMGYQIAYDIVNGNAAVDIHDFPGLKVLSATLAASQTIDAALNLASAATREANADEVIRVLNLGIQRIRRGTGHKPSFILLNDTLEQYWIDAFRRGDRMSAMQDVYNRTEATGASWGYAGIPVYDAGYAADSTTKIISDSHDSSNVTSAYLVYSSPTTTRLIQKYGMRTEGPHLMPNLIHKRWMAEQSMGLQMRDKFSVVRIKGFTVA